jgi:FKBP-type peptidyl-prolyl cis-trans isomerase SlyD
MSENPLYFVSKPNYSRVQQDKVIQLKYALFDIKNNNSALEYRDNLYYLHQGYGGMPTKIEAALDQQEVGFKTEIDLTPKEAFGDYKDNLRMQIPKNSLPPEAWKVGTRLDGESPDGSNTAFQVIAVADDSVWVDGNHPYAGKHLHFVLEVLDIRTASTEELHRGYAIRLS